MSNNDSPNFDGSNPDAIRFAHRYKKLFPVPRFDERTTEGMKEALSTVDFKRPVLITSVSDLLKPSFLYGILSLKRYIDFELYSATDLADIWFGNVPPYDDGTQRTLSSIETKIVGIYFGYSELPNKSVHSPIEQVIANAHQRGPLRERYFKGGMALQENPGDAIVQMYGQAVWIFYKGLKETLKNTYPTLYHEIEANDFQVVTLEAATLSKTPSKPSSHPSSGENKSTGSKAAVGRVTSGDATF